MILAYVTMGIANLKSGAGRLLLITVAFWPICSTLGGRLRVLPGGGHPVPQLHERRRPGADRRHRGQLPGELLQLWSIPPLFDTLSAVVLAFVLGLCLSTLRGKTIGDTLYNGMSDFSGVIDQVLHSVIIPLLPLYICGTFTNMTKSGQTFAILGILWKVFLVVILMHLTCIVLQFLVAGAVSRKNPFRPDPQPDPRLYHRPGHPVLRRHHPGEPAVRRGGRRLRGDPQLWWSPCAPTSTWPAP